MAARKKKRRSPPREKKGRAADVVAVETSALRQQLKTCLEMVERGNTILVVRYRTDVAGIVSVQDLELLMALKGRPTLMKQVQAVLGK